MTSIALITYHSAYNFGSVLQAYATQKVLKDMGYDPVIINYRMREQKELYGQFGLRKKGLKSIVKRAALLPVRGAVQEHKQAFEKFFAAEFNLTEEVEEPEEALSQLKSFDIAVSGSDQVWNKHSLELEPGQWRYMDPYLLKGYEGKRLSYASSIGSMSDDELRRIIPELVRFNAIALREAQSAEKLSRLLGKSVATVLDPTFLLKREEWVSNLALKKTQPQERYILAYFLWRLSRPRQILRGLAALKDLAQKRACQIRLVTPFIYLPYPDKHIEYHHEYGPREFLEALYNAEAVVTDAYHGTILSVNFGKEFFSLCNPAKAEFYNTAQFRKTEVLARLGLSDRAVYDIGELSMLSLPPIDYQAVQERLGQLREQSSQYLKRALSV